MMDIIDITYPLDEQLLIYPGDPVYKSTPWLSMERGDLCNVSAVCMGCHTGTHIDAPAHFVKDAMTVDQLDLCAINGPVRVVEFNENGNITADFLKKCHILPGERIIFKTMNSCRFAGRQLLENYSAVDLSAARFLVDAGVSCIGIDYMTIEPSESSFGMVHKTILGAGIPVIETLDLRSVSAGRYELVCLPLLFSGLDGSPVRAILKTL